MCELFGITSTSKKDISEYLKEFYSHSIEHRNGWGLAILDGKSPLIAKEPVCASRSEMLHHILDRGVTTSLCMAHIRKATIGEESVENTHPFTGIDVSGRTWTLIHNGTVFESVYIDKYQYVQQGTGDSERIILFILDEINKLTWGKNGPLSVEDRIKVIDDIVRTITPGNKVNLMIFDGDVLYVHKNEEGTLFARSEGSSTFFSTKPLSYGKWDEMPGNRLMVYKDGKLIYEGTPHNNTFVADPEKYRYLYLAYSGL